MFGRLSIWMNLSNYKLSIFWKEVSDDRSLWHQLFDKFFIFNVEIVSCWKINLEKVFSNCIPERRVSRIVHHPAHFRNDLIFKILSVFCNKEKTRERKETAVLGVSVFRVKIK